MRHCAQWAILISLFTNLSSASGQEPVDPVPGEPAAGAGPCAATVAVIVRAHSHPEEAETLQLTDCDGNAWTASLTKLKVLARPHGMDRPAEGREATLPDLDPGLLVRLAAIAQRWPGRSIAIVSGVRPNARVTSRHRVGRALDVAVEGVDRREVSEFARGLDGTGVGYYPNSTFTHVDVRSTSVYWIDVSAPGQRPRYVRTPPDPADPAPAMVASAGGEAQTEPPEVGDTAATPETPNAPPPAEANPPLAALSPADGAAAAAQTCSCPCAVADGAPSPSATRADAESVHIEPAPLSPEEVAALRARTLEALEQAMRSEHVETAAAAATTD